MAPEQAGGKGQAVGVWTDVYALGAVLYECLTGRPPFRAASAFDTLMQVLDTEPAAPRLLNPQIDRDLETILLKCLAKDPARRYASAAALADDLQAWREGRPIQARRPSLPERAVRWLRRQQRSMVLASASAAASIVLVIAAVVGWTWYANWRLARLSLDTEGGFLKAEVLDDTDGSVVTRFTVPTQEPHTLPPGHYRVRLEQKGRLSETFHFLAEPNGQYQFPVALADRHLWEVDIGNGESFQVVDLDGKPSVIHVTGAGLRRLDGASGKPVWPGGTVSLEAKDQPTVAGVKGYPGATLLSWSFLGNTSESPGLVRPALDLDGDGTGDLVWASRTSTSLLAVSGKSGKVLWWFSSRPALPKGVEESQIQNRQPLFGQTVLGQPVVADVDGDGKPDFIAAFTSSQEQFFVKNSFVQSGPQVWVEAVSGRTGQSLWRYNVPSLAEQWVTRLAEMPYSAAVVPMGGRRVVVLVAGDRLMGLDLESGKQAWPAHDLGSAPVRAPRFADLAAAGRPDAVLLEKAVGRGFELEVLSLGSRQKLWSTPLTTDGNQLRMQGPWQEPFVDVLHSGGKPEVITIFRKEDEATVAVRAAAAGTPRWSRRFASGRSVWREHHTRVVCGPDLDGDGYREVFVASLAWRDPTEPGRPDLFVDALSGKDGHSLWVAPADLPPGDWDVGPLRWWQAGPDGWPLLVVPCGPPATRAGGANWHACVFSAAGGRLEYTLPEFGYPQIADLNGDGIPDLYGQLVQIPFPRGGGKLHALKGLPPESWRLLSNGWQAARDFDGDGIPDLIVTGNPRPTVALSGRDAHLLWRTNVGGFPRNAAPVPGGDIDGDGVPDVLLAGPVEQSTPVLRALSGRTGREIWSVKLAPEPGGGRVNSISLLYLEYLPLSPRDRPGQADILFGYLVHRSGPSGPTEQGYLARVAVPDGRVLWNGPLQEPLRMGVLGEWRFRPGLADLDGDGILDLVLWVPAPTEDIFSSHLDLCAFSGRDGSLLWKGLGFTGRSGQAPILPFVNPPRALVGDVDGDGCPEVVVTTFREQSFEVVVLNGKDGQAKWSWRGDDGRQAHFGPNWENATPRWVHLAAGPALCVSIHDQKLAFGQPGKSLSQLVLLEAARGQILQRRDLKNPSERIPVWCLDLDGDGKDEVVFIDDGKVHATHGGIERELWSWPLPGGQGSILEVRPATVIVAAGSSVYGLDGATGVPRWRCEANNPTLLHPTDPHESPRLITSSPNPICRVALPVRPSGQYTMPTPTPGTYGPPPEDPRLARRLPWHKSLGLLLVEWGPVQPNFLVSLGFAGTLILAGLCLHLALRRRSWKLGLLALVLLAIPAGWAWFYFGAEVKEWAIPYLVWAVFILVPLLLFVFWPIRSLFGGRWRSVLLWLLLLMLSTAAVVAVAWGIDVRKKDPAEFYVWDGWYVAFLPGAWVAALLIVAAFLVRALFRAGRRLGGALLRRAKPA
jgi:outer membrane protein assembly factor BamB